MTQKQLYRMITFKKSRIVKNGKKKGKYEGVKEKPSKNKGLEKGR